MTMYEPEGESDEDCEVYFLKPVNEYNIVEKIKEANKELFGDTEADNVCSTDADAYGGANRKVTFAANLEDYEPAASALETLKLTQEFEAAVAEVDELQRKLRADYNFPAIEEEDASGGGDEMSELKQEGSKETIDQLEVAIVEQDGADVDELEEICEEIIVMDMEEVSDRTSSESGRGRRMVKQRTFDCATQEVVTIQAEVIEELEQDNKSLTNLLTSDGEEECCSAATFDIQVDSSDMELNDIEADDDRQADDEHETNEADDDDDDLSIIVASYLPDDFDPGSMDLTPPCSRKKLSTPQRNSRFLAPFSKRFPFRRRAHSRNSIGTACSSASCSSKHVPPPEVTDLKLNYKICCEYRRQLAQPEKLPKYTGYLSEYGLSREQLQKRDEQQQRKKRYVLEQALKTNDEELRKMKDNERAFTTWLRNKMRFPINKTRNMFDVKRSGNKKNKSNASNGSACAASNAVTNGQLNDRKL